MAEGSSSQGTAGGIERFTPKQLSITWGNDPRYWKMHDGDGPAELLQVCWLEVKHSMKAEEGFKYVVKFKLSLNKENYGWKDVPVFIMAKIGENGEDELSEPIKLLDEGLDKEAKEIPVGFEIRFERSTAKPKGPKSKNDDSLYFGLYEVWEGNWKSGLLVHEAMVEKLPLRADDSGSTSK